MKRSDRRRHNTGSPVKWVPNRIVKLLKKAGSTVRMVNQVEGIKSRPKWRCTVCGNVWTEMTEPVLVRSGHLPLGCRNCGHDGNTCDHGMLDSMNATSAYVLGCWCARGLKIDRSLQSPSKVTFTSKDTKVLRHLASVMSATHPVVRLNKGWKLTVTSVRLAGRLKGLNRKTLPNRIPSRFIRPFLLGYLDMQGQIEYGLSENPYMVRLDFAASPRFARRLRRLWLGSGRDARGSGHIHVHGKSGFTELRIVGTRAPKAFLDWLYASVVDEHPHLVYRGEMFMCWTFLGKLAGRVERLKGYVVRKSEEYKGLRVGMRRKLRGIERKHGVTYQVVIRVRRGDAPSKKVPVRVRKEIAREARGIDVMLRRARRIVDEVSSKLMVRRGTANVYLNNPSRVSPLAFKRGRLLKVPAVRERVQA